jgi:hypothetical protein
MSDSGVLLFLLGWFLVAATGVIYQVEKLMRRGRR